MSKHIHNRIGSIIKDLSNSERKIANYTLEHPSDVIKMTSSQLAQASQTSPATVIRFCRSIGIDSFTELKVKLSAEIDNPILAEYSDITPNEATQEIKHKLLSNATHSMSETVEILENQTVEAVTQVIYQVEVIYIYGIGASGIVAENMAQKLNRIGKIAMYFPDHHLLLTALASAPEKAALIAISNSGETEEVLRVVKIAKERHIQTIGIAQFGPNRLNNMVDYAIKTFKASEAQHRSAATSSLLNQFMVVDVLFFSYVSQHYHDYTEQLADSRQAIEQYENLMK